MNGQINQKYSNELGKLSRQRLYTKNELKDLKIESSLSDEEVKHLASQRKYCDSAAFTKTSGNRNDLIKSVLLLVVKVARSYWWSSGKHSVPIDDVISAGNLGATIAADLYLKTVLPAGQQPAKFSTYAYFWIKKYILDELNLSSQQLSTGIRAAYENRLAGKQFQSKDAMALGHDGEYESPINNDLVSDMKTGQEVLEIEDNHKRNFPILQRAFSVLTTQEREILMSVFGLGDRDIMSQKEVADKFGLSTSAVNATYKRAIHKFYWSMNDAERKIISNYNAQTGNDMRSILCNWEDQAI